MLFRREKRQVKQRAFERAMNISMTSGRVWIIHRDQIVHNSEAEEGEDDEEVDINSGSSDEEEIKKRKKDHFFVECFKSRITLNVLIIN